MNNDFRFTSDLLNRARELSKAEASEINPKKGTSISFQKFYIKAGQSLIKKLQQETEPKINANNERFVKKVADAENAPIKAELNEAIGKIKDNVRNTVNKNIDARIQQINLSRKVPVRTESLKLLQTIKMLVDIGAEISKSDWGTWSELFAGHYLEEKVFAGLAKGKGIDIIPAADPEKSIERLESFREMANQTIDHLDDSDASIVSLSFLSENPNAPIAKLINEIDSDLASIIPAEKLTVLQRLKDAKENAYKKDNVMLSVKIGSFIDKNMDKLATPEELNESLYAEAEQYIQKGMSAKKGDE